MDRLAAVKSLITPCETFADVGCDHGYVAEYVLREGLARRVICSDRSAGSLAKARARLGDQAEYVLCDGVTGYTRPVDLAVMAGMGGHNIIGILASAPIEVRAVIAAPQTDAAAVRAYLAERYEITADVTAKERGRFYDAIRACPGRTGELTETQLVFGVFCREKSETLRDRLEAWEKKWSGYPDTEKNRHLLALLEEVKLCQQ